MRWVKALLMGLVMWGGLYATDTLYVRLIQEPVTYQIQKDTISVWYNSPVSAIYFEALQDSVELYKPKVLNLYIYTYGGDPLVAIDFYYWLKLHGVKIRTFVNGISASAGVLMFLWGDERYISPHGLLFVHQISTWVFLEKYNPQTSENMTITLKTIQRAVEDFMVDRSGIDRKQFEEWMVKEKWFRANEAIRYGLATGIIGQEFIEKKEPEEEVNY